MKRLTLTLSILLYSIISFAQITYPVARKEPFDTVVFGVTISDEYFWMERSKNKDEVTTLNREQSKLAQTVLDSIAGGDLVEKEINEVLAALDVELWSLKPVGDYTYYNRYIPDEGTWLCRRKNASDAEEKILGKVIIKGKRYSIRKKAFAHQKPLIALMLTQSGESNPHVRIYNTDTKQFLPDSIAPVMFNDSRGVSMAWLPDDAALLYTQAPPTSSHGEKYFNGKIKKHTIGTKSEADKEVFGIGLNESISLKPHETPYIYSFDHSPYLIARVRAGDDDNYAFAVHYTKLNGAKTPWKKLTDYVNLGDGFDANGDYLYAITTGDPLYRLVKINMKTGTAPETFIQQQKDLLAPVDFMNSSGLKVGKDVLYCLVRRVGNMQILKIDLKSRSMDYLPLEKEPTIAEMALQNANDLVFATMSPIKSTVYKRYSYSNKKIETLPFAEKVFDASAWLTTEVILVPSRDGKNIPVSLVYARNLSLRNNNPMLIEGYGNSGYSRDLSLDPSYFPWLKYGGVYAYAHVRGGGELGEAWTNEGQFPYKMNSINDMVDVAAYFVDNGFTSPQKQLVMGGSAGTFLVGMAVNQRPDLFAGGIFLAGLPDLALHTDAAGGREQKSVGPKNTKEGFLSNYNVSSLYHINQNKKLPAMLIVHGATDYILSVYPASRYAVKLQQAQRGDRPILFLVDQESGHLGSQEEMISVMKFSLWQTGHPQFQLKH